MNIVSFMVQQLADEALRVDVEKKRLKRILIYDCKNERKKNGGERGSERNRR
jgi:hypothetical protein